MTDLRRIVDEIPNDDMVLTIIISCYNTRDLVRDCLRSIYEYPPSEAYEIILVDDGSVDGTSEMVLVKFPEVRLLRNDVNRNYAYSNNRALDQARGCYILLLNNDTIVLPQALDAMIAFLRAHPEVGVVGCKLLNEDTTVQWSVKSLPDPVAAMFGARSVVAKLFPNNRFSRKVLLHIGRDMTQPFEAGYVSGAASMMPLKVMREVGYLDVLLWYHIDADYCKRITDSGYKCFYLPTATIIHLNHKGGSRATLLARFLYLMKFEVQSYRYYRKHIHKSSWSPVNIVAVLGLSFHFVVLASAQTWAELAGAACSLLRPKRSVSAPTSGE